MMILTRCAMPLYISVRGVPFASTSWRENTNSVFRTPCYTLQTGDPPSESICLHVGKSINAHHVHERAVTHWNTVMVAINQVPVLALSIDQVLLIFKMYYWSAELASVSLLWMHIWLTPTIFSDFIMNFIWTAHVTRKVEKIATLPRKGPSAY